MDNFSKEDLDKAISTIASMISRSEKAQKKLKEGTPQASLTRNRIKALNLASSLITKELDGDYIIDNLTKEDLEKALPPVTSTIGKCEKVQEKLKEGTPHATLTRNMLKALYISSSLITKELKKR
jgi:hypothetical protein